MCATKVHVLTVKSFPEALDRWLHKFCLLLVVSGILHMCLETKQATSAWACNNCPVVFSIEAHCDHMGFIYFWSATPSSFSGFYRILNSTNWTSLLRQTGKIRDLPLDMHQKYPFRFPQFKSEKSWKWKQLFKTSFVIKHTWPNPVDNCDMGFQNRDRDQVCISSLIGQQKFVRNNPMLPTRMCMECHNRLEYCDRYR